MAGSGVLRRGWRFAAFASVATLLLLALLLEPTGAGAAAPASCGGTADDPSFTSLKTLTGEFGVEQQGAYVMLPFDVSAGTTAVRVRYCYDQPDLKPPGSPVSNTIDLGIYDARSGPTDLWDEDEFRGWGGSSHPDVTISPNGFSDSASYEAHPRQHVNGKTTRGFEPGPIPDTPLGSGRQWAVELGVAAVTPQSEGDSDGKVAWRVEIYSTSSSSYSDQPYVPASYDTTAANGSPGWYAGDLHVHAEHSSLGDATDRETFDSAFRPLNPPNPTDPKGAGLDFITLSDYVSDSGWGEIGRYQADYPGKLIERSAEVITYRGHINNHGTHTFVDYRTGPIYLRDDGGGLTSMRGARPASAIFDDIHAANVNDGWTQINHPTIFPSEVPGFSSFCRGCPWDYTDAETNYSKVDAIELQTGPAGLKTDPYPGPNPFTPLAVQFYEHAIDANGLNSNHIAAVGSSDTHHGDESRDEVTDPTGSFIGQATTIVYAPKLSESGVAAGMQAGHTYVKVFGNDGPDLRFCAATTAPTCDLTMPSGSVNPPAIMGDTVNAGSVNFTARVFGAGASAVRPGTYVLLVFKDGLPFSATGVSGDDFSFPFQSSGPGRYRLQLQRTGVGVGAIEDISSPIYLEPSLPPTTNADLSVSQSGLPDPVKAGDEVTYTVNVSNSGPDPASNSALSDVLPAGVSFESASPSLGSCAQSAGVVTCALGTLAKDASATVTIKVRTSSAGTIENTAIVHSDTADPDQTNNSSSLQTTVIDTLVERLLPGDCANLQRGDSGDNRLTGTPAGDHLRGGRGNDRINGLAGRDCLYGNRGNDRIRAVDGERDIVRCGHGYDRARADRIDSVRGCERVRRG
jgi:uncharacterized repeat protein (TIGR01451 family)